MSRDWSLWSLPSSRTFPHTTASCTLTQAEERRQCLRKFHNNRLLFIMTLILVTIIFNYYIFSWWNCKNITAELPTFQKTLEWDVVGVTKHFFFCVRNWMCGVSACENMQKRVSHGETVRVGSSDTDMTDYNLAHHTAARISKNTAIPVSLA